MFNLILIAAICSQNWVVACAHNHAEHEPDAKPHIHLLHSHGHGHTHHHHHHHHNHEQTPSDDLPINDEPCHELIVLNESLAILPASSTLDSNRYGRLRPSPEPAIEVKNNGSRLVRYSDCLIRCFDSIYLQLRALLL